jgi:AI-2E family transporter
MASGCSAAGERKQGILALGLIAGLVEFVPVIGSVLAAVPALLLALTLDVQTAVWTLLLYLAIQQVQGNLVTPLVTRHMLALPPALTLFAIVAFGLVFGFLGVLLAAPLTVVALVAVKKLWVRDTGRKDRSAGRGPAVAPRLISGGCRVPRRGLRSRRKEQPLPTADSKPLMRFDSPWGAATAGGTRQGRAGYRLVARRHERGSAPPCSNRSELTTWQASSSSSAASWGSSSSSASSWSSVSWR